MHTAEGSAPRAGGSSSSRMITMPESQAIKDAQAAHKANFNQTLNNIGILNRDYNRFDRGQDSQQIKYQNKNIQDFISRLSGVSELERYGMRGGQSTMSSFIIDNSTGQRYRLVFDQIGNLINAFDFSTGQVVDLTNLNNSFAKKLVEASNLYKIDQTRSRLSLTQGEESSSSSSSSSLSSSSSRAESLAGGGPVRSGIGLVAAGSRAPLNERNYQEVIYGKLSTVLQNKLSSINKHEDGYRAVFKDDSFINFDKYGLNKSFQNRLAEGLIPEKIARVNMQNVNNFLARNNLSKATDLGLQSQGYYFDSNTFVQLLSNGDRAEFDLSGNLTKYIANGANSRDRSNTSLIPVSLFN